MQGAIKPIRVGSGSLGRYLEECESPEGGFGGYLEGGNGGMRFSRMSGGSETDGRPVDADGLDAMLHGKDPFSGGKLRDVKDSRTDRSAVTTFL